MRAKANRLEHATVYVNEYVESWTHLSRTWLLNVVHSQITPAQVFLFFGFLRYITVLLDLVRDRVVSAVCGTGTRV